MHLRVSAHSIFAKEERKAAKGIGVPLVFANTSLTACRAASDKERASGSLTLLPLSSGLPNNLAGEPFHLSFVMWGGTSHQLKLNSKTDFSELVSLYRVATGHSPRGLG